MIGIKPKRHHRIRNSTGLTRILSNTYVRFGVAGFLSIITTLLLFIFMNYLLGNFDHFALTAAENLFRLDTVILEESPDQADRDIQAPLLPPKPVEIIADEDTVPGTTPVSDNDQLDIHDYPETGVQRDNGGNSPQ